jgi:uncharacterized membrane protein
VSVKPASDLLKSFQGAAHHSVSSWLGRPGAKLLYAQGEIIMASTHTAISREVAENRVAVGSAATSTNIGDLERLLSIAGGGVLACAGLRQGRLTGWTLAALGGGLIYRGLSGHCSCYTALGVSTAEAHNPVASVAAGCGVKVLECIAVNRPAEQLYELWRDFEGLPRFMSHLVSVKVDGARSHWIAHGPARTRVEWDAEIINQTTGRLIAWRSLAGALVSTAGSVHFTPLSADRGTEVRVVLKYDPPAGKLGSWLAWLFGAEPGQQIRADLRRFKQLAETGEVATTKGQPSGRT